MSEYWRVGDRVKCCKSIAEVSSIEGRGGDSQGQIIARLLPARMATNFTVSGQNKILIFLG